MYTYNKYNSNYNYRDTEKIKEYESNKTIFDYIQNAIVYVSLITFITAFVIIINNINI